MAYNIQLAQINVGINGLNQSNTSFGFPANTNFNTLLMSFWGCGPFGTLPGTTTYYPGIWPEFNSAQFFTFDPSGTANDIIFTNQQAASYTHFYHGVFALPTPGTRMHYLMSVDTHAQVVQLYINDAPVTITGGTWDGTAAGLTPPFNFNVRNSINIWAWDVSGVISSGNYPGLGDAWMHNPPSFVDLTVTANRRKFINSNLSPVDLGNTGTNPFGYQPALYMSIRPGGIATDILINRGSGGPPTWNYAGSLPSFQAPNACVLPAPPSGQTQLGNADLFFSPTGTFVDLSQARNRRLFASATGGAQWLGSSATIPLGGVKPAVYLQAFPGNPDAFASNADGVGGRFTILNP